MAEMTDACHLVQLLVVEMGSRELFAWTGLELLSSSFLPPE
jgi:hypothetical protein